MGEKGESQAKKKAQAPEINYIQKAAETLQNRTKIIEM